MCPYIYTSSTINRQATDKQKMFIHKIAIVVLSLIPLGFALKPFDMVQFIVLVQASMVASFFFATVVIGLNWKRATGTAALWSMAGGVITVVMWFILDKPFGLNEVIPGVLVSTILMIVISFFTKPVPEDSLRPFFDDIK
ncbi:hypothetical protein CSV69_15540 [Sporosarcina sp. P26b]|uniref:sodium:solute symporter family transporter n=1 Tax=Sporosarcina sp. P26b TaxID=2048253 RepID=UPI000C16E69A|nr:hypothetical protein [Sporosarcina sp. P26b]PIC94658.1 hypothetical protein CSV69_15540 [Sporosarcina sp. P26b]